MSNTTKTQERSFNARAGRAMPRELLVETLARVPLPIVVDDGQGELFLNRQAQTLWPNTVGDRQELPITLCGRNLDLMSLQWPRADREHPALVSQVGVPVGELNQVELSCWRVAPDSPACRMAILWSTTRTGRDAGVLTDRVTRLKAIVHEIRNMLTSARPAC